MNYLDKKLRYGKDNIRMRFIEKTHQYIWETGEEFLPVSSLYKSYPNEFAKEEIALRMATGMLKKTGKYFKASDVVKVQKQIIEDWEIYATERSDRGTKIHKALEEYILGNEAPEEYESLYKEIDWIMKPYTKFYPESMIFHLQSKVCGTADLTALRSDRANRQGVRILDIFDHKTNLEMEFQSINRKKNYFYNQFFLPPFDFMEDTSFNRYVLQQNMYGYMAEQQFDVKIGSLALLHISEHEDFTYSIDVKPIPYMPWIGEVMINKRIEQLEQVNNQTKNYFDDDFNF